MVCKVVVRDLLGFVRLATLIMRMGHFLTAYSCCCLSAYKVIWKTIPVMCLFEIMCCAMTCSDMQKILLGNFVRIVVQKIKQTF